MSKSSPARIERQRMQRAGLAAPPATPPTGRWTALSFLVKPELVEMIEAARTDFNAMRAQETPPKPPVPFSDFLINGLITAGLQNFAALHAAHQQKQQLVVLAGAMPPGPRP